MKSIILIALLINFNAFASSPFNGTFCGDGTELIKYGGFERKRKGERILTVETTEKKLHLKYNKFFYDRGRIIDRPEIADIVDGRIVYNGNDVGSITRNKIEVSLVLQGHQIDYTIRLVSENEISYMREERNTSNDNFSLSESLSMKPGADCTER